MTLAQCIRHLLQRGEARVVRLPERRLHRRGRSEILQRHAQSGDGLSVPSVHHGDSALRIGPHEPEEQASQLAGKHLWIARMLTQDEHCPLLPAALPPDTHAHRAGAAPAPA